MTQDNASQRDNKQADDTHGYPVAAHGDEHSDENKASDEIKADIDQTRHEMSATINQLQARLDPTRLKEQVQETVRTTVGDSTEALVNYVRANFGDIGYTMVDTIKQNPIPATLVGVGIGWLIFKSLSSSSSSGQVSNPSEYGDPRRYPRQEAGQYQGRPSQGSRRYGGAQNPDYRRQPTYSSGGSNQPEQGRVGQAVQSAQEKANAVLEQARDTAGQLTEQVQETAQHAGYLAQEKVGQVREQAAQLGEQAQQTLQDTGRQVQRTVENNLVPFGIVTLAAGLLIGLALPATETENQVMGETRDQLLDNAQVVAQDVKQRVQTIVDEKLPEVKQAAQKAAEDLKQTGKTVTEDLKQTLKDAGESAQQNVTDIVQADKAATKAST